MPAPTASGVEDLPPAPNPGSVAAPALTPAISRGEREKETPSPPGDGVAGGLPPSPAPSARPHPLSTPDAPGPLPRATPQLAPAIVTLAARTPDAAQTLTIRLDPAELGHVQLTIARPPDGPARVELVVERPDTLMTLLQDRPRLDRMLDHAGVPPEGRTIQFTLAHQLEPADPPRGGFNQHDPRDRPRHQPRRRLRAGIDITA